MKAAWYRLPVKAAAVILSLVFFLTFLFSGAAVIYTFSQGIDGGLDSFYRLPLTQQLVREEGWRIVMRYKNGWGEDKFRRLYGKADSNLGFLLLDEETGVVIRNYSPDTTGLTMALHLNDCKLECRLADPIQARDSFYLLYWLFRLVAPRWQLFPVLLVLTAAAWAASLVFLCCAAGHRPEGEGIALRWIDRIPLDLYLGLAGLLLFLIAAVTVSLWDVVLNLPWLVGATLLFVIPAVYFLCLAVLLSCVARAKAGTFWRNTLCWKAAAFCVRLFRRFLQWVLSMTGRVSLVWKSLAVLAAYEVLNLLFLEGATFLWLLLQGMVCLSAAVCVYQLKQLEAAGQRLADGDLEAGVDTSRLLGTFRRQGEHLNAIRSGMSIAVDQRMRSERLKTELITNVSHDIKTPLTSIINYVDLLQKEEDPQRQQEYLGILQRQTQKLKKLTEDLIDASKASTGNLSMNLAPTDLTELLRQAAGEYQERLEAGKLELVTTLPETLTVLADGKLLWRVFDNLLQNVCKYAMPGTRVYLTAETDRENAVITLKNISREPLNVDAEELTERFVRGDSARHTEGSGLGLNIARSLVELQKGTFSLVVDGDLFKAELRLNLAKPPKEKAN